MTNERLEEIRKWKTHEPIYGELIAEIDRLRQDRDQWKAECERLKAQLDSLASPTCLVCGYELDEEVDDGCPMCGNGLPADSEGGEAD